MAIFIFDRQHVGKPGRRDLGAGADLDGDGDIENDEMEANLTPVYIRAAKERLETMGHTVYVFESGRYSERHVRANQIARENPDEMVGYIACHLNAGGGNYSAFFYDQRSPGGKRFAESLSRQMTGAQLSGVDRHIVRGCSKNEWKNAFYTIKDIWNGPGNISGACAEPVFMDNEDHQAHLTAAGLRIIGRALADACVLWAESD